MTDEFGPPIAVNGKRPDWLGVDDLCMISDAGVDGWLNPEKARYWYWTPVTHVRLRADHPYYQSAEYKASVGGCDDDMPPLWALDQAARYAHDLNWAASQLYMTKGSAVYDSIVAHARTLAEHVTPPDPLAAGRDLLAGLLDMIDYPGSAKSWRSGCYDDIIPAAMEYLRANKGRL